MARHGEGIPIPDVIDPPESMRVTLCIPKNRDHSAAFFGALYQLTVWSSWQENGTTDGRDLAAVWWRYYTSWDRAMNNIDCEDGMNYCCVEQPQLKRIDPVSGGMEISVDGGATWTPDPASPKFAIVKPPPPVTAGVVAAKCDAAANAKQGIMSIVNTTSSDIATASTIFELATLVAAALLNAFLVVVTGGLASPLVLTVTGAIWGAMTAVWEMGQAGFDAYWNEDVFDALLCALYDNIGEDGSFNDEQYNGFRTQFKFNSPSSPARDMVMTAIGVGGAEGLSVMASYGGAVDSDCSECLPPEACDVTGWVDYRTGATPFEGQSITYNVDNTLTGVGGSVGGDYRLYLSYEATYIGDGSSFDVPHDTVCRVQIETDATAPVNVSRAGESYNDRTVLLGADVEAWMLEFLSTAPFTVTLTPLAP